MNTPLPAPNNPPSPNPAGSGKLLLERRKRTVPVAVDRRGERDESDKVDRRRMVDPTTCEREYTEEEILFMRAMDQYKRDNRRPFPTWSEVLEVLISLGYRKVAEPTKLPGAKAPLKG